MKRFAQLTLDQLATFPPPGAGGPQSLEFLEDGSAVVYLLPRENSTTLDLWLYDVRQGQARLLATPPGEGDAYSLDEELRRERAREAWGGITSFQLAAGTLLVPHGGSLWHAPLGEPLRRLEIEGEAVDPRLFPDGRQVAYVAEGDLHVLTLDSGAVRKLTHGAEPGLSHGLAEYAAQEELGRAQGYWIRPDGGMIAFTEADERHVPFFPIVHQGGDPVWLEQPRYPFVSAQNARVRLGTVPVGGGEPVWYEGRAEYLARVAWTPGGDLCALWLDRLQRRAEWVLYHPGEPQAHPWLAEESEPWYNLTDDTRFLESGEILYSSERSGARRLYLRTAEGEERMVGGVQGNMAQLLGLDEERRIAYYVGWEDDPTQRHLFSAPLAGGAPRRLTEEAGLHYATFSKDARSYVERFSSLQHPATATLRHVGDAAQAVLYAQPGLDAASLGLAVPEIVEIAAEDGTPLYGAIYRPAAPRPGKLPLIVDVYGGPHAQLVAQTWEMTVDLEAQYMAQQGYVVWKLDGRGSYGRGLAFEAPINRSFGTVELDDQVTGVRYLVDHENIDPKRVAITGWSYGGFMTLTALLKAPETFTAGVAGAPVTDFRWYDTAYTERYMGFADTDRSAYETAALPPLADRLEGDLLIIHGLVDENVHFRHTAQMIAAFVETGKKVDLQVLPESRHSVRGFAWKRLVAERRTRFLQEHV